ncbi:petH, partial [Symbiodinium sp. CCMP2456]
DDLLQQKYEKPLHGLNLQGVALTNPGSTYLYLGLEGGSDLLEYEWHSSHQVFRSFHLPGFPHHGALGLRSVTFVPTTASDQQGYFYVGTDISGEVYIYEAPLLVNEGPKAPAESIKIWTPLQGDKHVAGIEYSDGYLFVSYDDGLSSH